MLVWAHWPPATALVEGHAPEFCVREIVANELVLDNSREVATVCQLRTATTAVAFAERNAVNAPTVGKHR